MSELQAPERDKLRANQRTPGTVEVCRKCLANADVVRAINVCVWHLHDGCPMRAASGPDAPK